MSQSVAQRPMLMTFSAFWMGILFLVIHLIMGLIVHIFEGMSSYKCVDELHYVMLILLPPFGIFSHALFLRYLEKSISRSSSLYGCILGIVLSIVSLIIVLYHLAVSWRCSSTDVRAVLIYSVLVIILWLVLWCATLYHKFIRAMDETIKRDFLSIFRCGCVPILLKKLVLLSPYFFAWLYSVFYVMEYW